MDGLPSDVQALLCDVLRGESQPAVVAAAAEEVEERYAPDTLDALLEAHQRLLPGPSRQQVARAYARWAPWQQLKRCLNEARNPDEFDAWVAAASRYVFAGPKEGATPDLADIYRRTGGRAIRRDCFYSLMSNYPPPLELMKKLAALESDPDLRTRYQRLLDGARPTELDPWADIDVREILFD